MIDATKQSILRKLFSSSCLKSIIRKRFPANVALRSLIYKLKGLLRFMFDALISYRRRSSVCSDSLIVQRCRNDMPFSKRNLAERFQLARRSSHTQTGSTSTKCTSFLKERWSYACRAARIGWLNFSTWWNIGHLSNRKGRSKYVPVLWSGFAFPIEHCLTMNFIWISKKILTFREVAQKKASTKG